jgi:hypothetical protein
VLAKWGACLTGDVLAKCGAYAQVTVRMNKYSVPARLVGRPVRVLLHASDLAVYDGTTEVARHERLMTKGAG